MIVRKEKNELAHGASRRERLRELRETPLETALPRSRNEVSCSAELRRVSPKGTDEIREQDERVLVAALEREPRSAPAGGAEEVGVLRKHSRLPVSRRRVDEREPVAPCALQAIE